MSHQLQPWSDSVRATRRQFNEDCQQQQHYKDPNLWKAAVSQPWKLIISIKHHNQDGIREAFVKLFSDIFLQWGRVAEWHPHRSRGYIRAKKLKNVETLGTFIGGKNLLKCFLHAFFLTFCNSERGLPCSELPMHKMLYFGTKISRDHEVHLNLYEGLSIFKLLMNKSPE